MVAKKVTAREGALISMPSRIPNSWIPLVIARRGERSRLFLAFAFHRTALDPSEWVLPNPTEALWRGLTHDGAIRDGTWTIYPTPKGFDRDAYNIPILTSPGPGGRCYLHVLDDRNPDRTVSMSLVDWDKARSYPSNDLYDPWILEGDVIAER